MVIYELLRELQPRCVNCNSNKSLQAHHRVFKSEGDIILQKLLEEFSNDLNGKVWLFSDIENLVILCSICHLNKVHGGDGELRKFFRESYTDRITGFNIPFLTPKKTLF